jgi:hypothetical protein
MTQPLDCDPVREQAKADRLDRLYAESGRTNGLYTGLHAEDLRRRAADLNPEPAA